MKEHSFAFKHHFVSAYIRGMQTAWLLDIPGAKWVIDDRFCEKDGGIFHELHPDEAEEYRKRFKNRAHELDPYRSRPERGQSFFDLETSVRPAIEPLPTSSLVVCHGHLIRVIDHMIMKGENSWHMKSLWDSEWQIPNCGLIEYTKKSPKTGHISENLFWRRMSDPCQDRLGEWEQITRPRYDNDALKILIDEVLGRLSQES